MYMTWKFNRFLSCIIFKKTLYCFLFSSNRASTVTEELMNTVLKNVLTLILSNIGTLDAPWMNRIASMYDVV